MSEKIYTFTEAELEALLNEAHLRGSADAFASLRKTFPEFLEVLENLAAVEIAK